MKPVISSDVLGFSPSYWAGVWGFFSSLLDVFDSLVEVEPLAEGESGTEVVETLDSGVGSVDSGADEGRMRKNQTQKAMSEIRRIIATKNHGRR